MDRNDPQHAAAPPDRAAPERAPGAVRRLGRRTLGRAAALTRSDGRELGRTVAARHERPEPVRAAMRLVPQRTGVARSPGAAAGAASAAAPAPAGPAATPAGDGWTPSPTESTIMPGISDWAAEWLFGDADTAVSTGTPFMGGAGLTPATPEEKRVARVKRGGPEVARGAKIIEPGSEAAARRSAAAAGTGARGTTPPPEDPAPAADARARSSETPAAPSAGPMPAPGPAGDARVARAPAAPAPGPTR